VGGSGQFDGVVGGQGSFSGSPVGGSGQFGGSSIGGSGSFPGSQVGGSGQFDGVVGGQGSFSGSPIGGSGQFGGSSIGGSGSFPGSQIGGSGSNIGSGSFSRTVGTTFQRNFNPDPVVLETSSFTVQDLPQNKAEPISSYISTYSQQQNQQLPFQTSTFDQNSAQPSFPVYQTRPLQQPEVTSQAFESFPAYQTRPFRRNISWWLPSNVHEGHQAPLRTTYYIY